ncbi:MAG: phage tail sheath protein, partial [Chloroflexales bacterium]|nr:phage tail sheath protein [Chloroflexales bacterium]
AALSYGALYHPWPVVGDETSRGLVRLPPDGPAIGVLARRALARGAWVAPANEALRDVVALAPPIARERHLDLLEAQVNLLRHEPQGFMALSADTLSGDPELRPINVRRLLQLLRRLALRHGATYVFEPNDESFRRLVRRTFSALLGDMFARGAFAGARPETAYQVVTSESAQDSERGRLIVELRVAPAQPLAFLTVRLVQSDERGLSVVEA